MKKNCSSFDFENVSILHVCPQWNQWLFLEAWYSNKEENSINQHVEFLRVYLKLKNCYNIFSTRVMHICHLLAYFTIVILICIRNNEGHRCDRNVLLFKHSLISVNAKFQDFLR